MSAHLDTRPVSPMPEHHTPQVGMSPLRILLALAMLGLIVAIPFLAAGTLDWPAALVYVCLFLAAALLSRAVVAFRDPDLLRERSRFTELRDVEGWDHWLMPFVGLLGPLLMLLVAGLDRRFDWSAAFAPAVQVAAFAVIGVGFALAVWAMIANRFFSAVARIQTERGHVVVSEGPYRFVRHPAYTGALLAYLATPFALSSWWALIPALLTVAAIFLRTSLEDRWLHDQLPGYKEYAQGTRSRLLPGVW